MNSSSSCHEIEDCPNLFVDAFRTFRTKISDKTCNFILTHYHGDHYNGLPKEYKYQGPAMIHCTPVTAALLKNVHQVPHQFVVEHEYGVTWKHELPMKKEAQVTFYDANHCPGAAIVLIELPDGTCHLHTGDMRYHAKMQSYPKLQQAVKNRKMGLVYLDTTYGHPKHELVPQEEAVDTIASYVERVLQEETTSTIVLLSCYSIGKEKVLWEVSKRTNQLVFVSERKRKMLECIQGYEEDDSSQILTRCTLDASRSDVHVIPMGMAGEIWPYFQPNYRACVEYVEQLNKKYDRVVAFLPTGWADATNWNKKNAVSHKRMKFNEKEGHIDIEIRLVCYSEHSAFTELCSFVEYLRPRQVVPTVFADENDRRKIEGFFRKYIDSSRAKQRFFKSMRNGKAKVEVRRESGETEVIEVDTTTCAPEPKKQRLDETCDDEQVATLVSMGFDAGSARIALKKYGGNVEAALDGLLVQDRQQDHQVKPRGISDKKPTAKTDSKPSPTTIKSFFSPKPNSHS